MDSYSVQAVLSAVDKNFTSTMQGARNTLGGLESAANKSKTSIMGIAAGIGVFKLVSKAVGTVTSAVGGAIKRFDTLNNYPKVMTALGYSAEESKRSIDTLSKGIDGLPTTLDGIAQSAQMLTASMGDLGKGTDTAVALNDMFLAGGQGAYAASRALTQYNQILARGKVGQQEWNTLVEVAPGQMDQLAKTLLGASAGQADLKNALDEGVVSIEDMNEAIIRLDKEGGSGFESFRDQALSATGGIETAMTNLKSAVTRGLANTLGAIDEALEKNGLPKMGEALNKVKPMIDSVFSSINDTIRGLTDLQGSAKSAGAVLVGAFAAGGIQGLPVVASMAKDRFDKLGVGVKNLGTKISGIGSQVKGLGGRLKKLIPTGFFEKNKNALSAFGQQWSHIGKRISGNIPIIGKIGDKFKALGGTIGKISGPLAKVGGMVGQVGGTFASKWAGALGTIGKVAFKAIAPAALIGAAIAGLGLIQDNFGDKIKSMVDMAVRKGPELIKGFVSGITSRIPSLISSGAELVRQLATAIQVNLPFIIQGAVGIVLALVQGISENAQSLMESGMMIISSLVEALLVAAPQLLEAGLNLLMSLVQGMTDSTEISTSAGNILRTLVDSISAMAELLLANGPEIIAEIVEGIVNALPGLIQAAIEILLRLANSIIEHLPDLLAATVRIIQAICQGLIQNLPALIQGAIQIILTLAKGIIQNLPKIISAAKQIITTIGSTIKSLASQALQWGKDIINGIANGIRSAIGNIASAASSIGSKIKEFLHFSRPDRGPLREYEKWMPDMMRGIARGITDNLSVVRDAASQVADIIAGAQEPFGSGQLAYSAAIGGDVTYGADIAALAARPIVVDNSIVMDGRELAKGSTSYIQGEMASREKFQSYIRGVK